MPRDQRWAMLYESVLSESDESKRLDLIALANGAVFQRKQELTDSQVNGSERVALEHATYVLSSLRRQAMFNLGREEVILVESRERP